MIGGSSSGVIGRLCAGKTGRSVSRGLLRRRAPRPGADLIECSPWTL